MLEYLLISSCWQPLWPDSIISASRSEVPEPATLTPPKHLLGICVLTPPSTDDDVDQSFKTTGLGCSEGPLLPRLLPHRTEHHPIGHLEQSNSLLLELKLRNLNTGNFVTSDSFWSWKVRYTYVYLELTFWGLVNNIRCWFIDKSRKIEQI